MVFDNELSERPSLRRQVVQHLPIALVVFGLLSAAVAMHVAVAGLAALAVVHIVIGLALYGIRKHRSEAT